MGEWKDQTSYSQGERARGVEPRVWALGEHPLAVIVQRLHWVPGRWFLRFDPLGIFDHPLEALDADAAREEAVRVMRGEVARFAAAMRETLGDEEEVRDGE